MPATKHSTPVQRSDSYRAEQAYVRLDHHFCIADYDEALGELLGLTHLAKKSFRELLPQAPWHRVEEEWPERWHYREKTGKQGIWHFQKLHDQHSDQKGYHGQWLATEKKKQDYDPALHELRSVVLQRLLQNTSQTKLLAKITREVEKIFPSFSCSIMLVDDFNQAFINGSCGSLPRSYTSQLEGLPVSSELGTCGAAASFGRRFISPDLQQDPLWPARFRALARKNKLASCWSEPLIYKEKTTLGTLALYQARPCVPMESELYALDALRDMTVLVLHQYRMAAEEKRHKALQDCLIDLASFYVDIPNMSLPETISKGLAKIGKATASDRAYLFELNPVRATISNTVDWCATGIPSFRDKLQDLPRAAFEPWLQVFEQGDIVNIPNIEEEAESPIKEALTRKGVKSLLVVPLIKQGQVSGFIGFDQISRCRRFNPEEVSLLKVFADIVNSLQARHHQYQKIKQHSYFLDRSEKMAKIGTWEFDIATNKNVGTPFTKAIFDLPLDYDLSFEETLSYFKAGDSRERAQAAATSCIEERREFSEEFEIITQKGREKWILVQGRPVVANGKVRCIEGVVRDITEDKKSEQLKNLQYRLNKAILYAHNMEDLAGRMQAELRTILDLPNFVIAHYDAEKQEFYAPFMEDVRGVTQRWDARKSLSKYALRKGQALHLFRQDIEELLAAGELHLVGEMCEEWLGLPIFSQEEALGIIIIQHYESRPPIEREIIQTLEIVARQVGVFIERLKNQETMLLQASAIEQLPVGIVIADLQNKISYANPIFCQTHGAQNERELLGRDFLYNHRLKPRSKVYRSIMSRLTQQQVWQGELLSYGANDEEYWQEVIVAPVLDKKGRTIRYLSVKKDISSEKGLRDRLKDNLEQIQVINDNTPTIVWKMEVVENREYVNTYISKLADRLLDLPKGTLRNDVYKLFSFIKEDYQSHVLSRLNRLLEKTGSFGTVTYEVEKGDGSTAWFQTTARSMRNDNRVMIYGSTIDITELKRQSESLIKSKNQMKQLLDQAAVQNKRLRDYAFIVSHNIRNSVANIMGLNDLLQAEPANEEYLQMLTTSVDNLDSTIRSLNELLTFENTLENKGKSLCSVKDAVQRVLKSRQFIIREKQADIVTDIPDKLRVKAIPAFFESIFDNLISNSLKYGITPDAKKLEVTARETAQEIEIEIRDHGVGIDLKKHGAKLFDAGSRFHRLSADGKGLGLFLTKNQVEALQGEITVESKPGQGAAFKVFFPNPAAGQ